MRAAETTKTGRSLRRVLPAALLTAVLVTVAAAVAPAPAAATVTSRILTILKQEHCSGSRTGVSVLKLSPARSAYARNTHTPLRPASNTKLVTATAALERWGPDHRFKTELYLPAAYATVPYAIGTIRGDVYLKGYGDPSLSTPTFQRERLGVTTSSITGFVAHLKALGVTRIRGHVVGDGSWFDDKKRVAVWNPGIEEDCGPLGALSVNEGLRDGERVKNPPRYAARRLTEALEDAGIAVSGDPRAGRVPGDACAHGDTGLGPAARSPQAAAQAQRQLLRRDAGQGPRQGLRRRGFHPRRPPRRPEDPHEPRVWTRRR